MALNLLNDLLFARPRARNAHVPRYLKKAIAAQLHGRARPKQRRIALRWFRVAVRQMQRFRAKP